VHCHEGQVLSALLEPHLHEHASPQLLLVVAPMTEGGDDVGRSGDCIDVRRGRTLRAQSIDACAIPAGFEVGWNVAVNEWQPSGAVGIDLARSGRSGSRARAHRP